MRKVAVIDPRDKKVFYKTVPDKDISRATGFELSTHNIVQRGSTAANYGLFSNAMDQPSLVAEYYGLNGQLYHGTGVLYAFDREGRTRDIEPQSHPQPLWLGNLDTVRVAVVNGLVDKPPTWEC